MHPNLAINVNSWIIQDGNYGDFSVGDRMRFALEFAGNPLSPSERTDAELTHLDGNSYRVCGQVKYSRPNVWVIDFGFMAFWESEAPVFATIGSWLEGDISLGIDPFFYKEYLCEEEGIPNLFYNWTVTKIECNETPWLESVNERGGRTLTRDDALEKWAEVDNTNAWTDDDGRADYILHIVKDA